MKCFKLHAFRYVLIASLMCVSGCSSRKEPAKKLWPAMGTFVTITVPERESKHLEQYASAAREVISELEEALSIFNPDSEISRINRSAGKSPVPVSNHTREMLELAEKYAEISGGCFDPTIWPLVRLWGFSGGTVPDVFDKTSVRSALRHVGYRHLAVSNNTAYLDTPEMGVDLGGIAKGYAVDVCYRKLMEMNAENIMINLGGNIRCYGTADQGSAGTRSWKVGVRNPFNHDQIIGTITLTGGMAVATSGNYERFVTIGNKRYAHIIDPRTGYPVQGMAGVTVISTNAVEADAMSTALFVMGPEQARSVLARMPHCHALFVPDRRPLQIWITPGFTRYFTPGHAFTHAVIELWGKPKKSLANFSFTEKGFKQKAAKNAKKMQSIQIEFVDSS